LNRAAMNPARQPTVDRPSRTSSRLRRRTGRPVCLAFTLVEVLVVVMLLGIAGAMVVPSMRNVGVLRIQAAVRTLVADVTFMQSDALAFQSRRVMVFGKVAVQDPATGQWEIVDGDGYTIYAPPPGAASLTPDAMTDVAFDPDDPDRPLTRDFDLERYAGAEITDVDINGGTWLIFDELGGPVASVSGDEPGSGGSLRITGPESAFEVLIEPYTGRISVNRVEL